ncbi:MAG: hypothetical protein ACRDOW_02385 [Nocardioidaceae bacterium]
MGTARIDLPATAREKLVSLTELFTDRPEAGQVDVPSATAVLESGLAVRTVGADGWCVLTDMPEPLGGAASGFRIRSDVEAPGVPPDQLAALVRWAEGHSPVLSTLRDTVTVTTTPGATS